MNTIFKLKNKSLKITIEDGEVISVESGIKTYTMDNLEMVFRVAIQTDLEKFLEIFKLLRLDTSQYKMAKKILKEEKSRLESNIQKIMQWIPQY